MSDKMIIALLISLSTLGAVISSSSLKDKWQGDNTDISLHISDDVVKFTASYPSAKAKKVHPYLQQVLHLSDLRDLSALEIKQYKTPDGVYSMNIKSRDGYIRIIMDRHNNPPDAAEQVKLICEGVRKVLGDD